MKPGAEELISRGMLERLMEEMASRRDAIVEEWFEAVGRTCFVPLAACALRERLGGLLDRFVSLWLAESIPDEEAQRVAEEIGADLASLHLVNAEALGQTLRILGTSLPCDLPGAAHDLGKLHLRQANLLQRLAIGYYRQGCTIVLDEQEQIRSALLVELQAADARLRAAHDDLESRVAQRTAELAQINTELRNEVAERLRVEQELRDSKERWRSLVENAPDLIGTVDRQGRIRFLNRLPGSAVPLESVIGADAASFAQWDYQEDVRRTLHDVFETGVRVTREIAFTSVTGNRVWYAISYGPIWQDGEVVEVLFVSRNIDRRKKLEQAKDNLIHDVSHELRTPLAKIRMSLELLGEIAARDEPDMERARRLSHLALSSVDSVLDTLEDILDLSRLEAGMWSYEAEPVGLGALIDLVVADMAPAAQEKGLVLAAEVPAALPLVVGDRDKLQRVLVNLIDNAVKFSRKGTITLAAGTDDRAVHVTVADEGEGILPENRERVFERFFQEKKSSHGVGIGLSICKAIVEAHGGKIWVESEGRGLGATFHAVLPAAPEEEAT
ncbi:MAG: PAS domain S-box protein [Anaerolineae bacterium]|nr:PAS domain S-box protein [Anaerolineae bacterium]